MTKAERKRILNAAKSYEIARDNWSKLWDRNLKEARNGPSPSFSALLAEERRAKADMLSVEKILVSQMQDADKGIDLNPVRIGQIVYTINSESRLVRIDLDKCLTIKIGE